MQVISSPNSYIWYDPQLLSGEPAHCFEPEYWQQRDAITGSAKGRGTTWFVCEKGIEMALRHYRRGGLLGRMVKDQYMFTGWDKTRCAQELALLKLLAEGGVNVPRPVAARAVRHGMIYRADILVEKVACSKDLVAVLQQRQLNGAEWLKVGALVRQMHDLQVCHTDLNIHNILLDAEGKFWLIDFDKCYRAENNSWKLDNLKRLLRSFRKEQVKRNIQWDESQWSLLLKGYGSLPVGKAINW